MVQKCLRTHDNERGLLWRCRVARFDDAVSKVFNLLSYRGSHYPVVQYPNGVPSHGDLVTALFIREPRHHGEGERNVVRIYRLADQVLRGEQNPKYIISAALVKNCEAENPVDVRLEPENLVRFRIVGFGGKESKNAAAIFVKRGDEQITAR